MVGPQSSSFIPKQPASGKVKRGKVRRIYIFTYVSFVLFFGTLIASAGTFFYDVSVNSQLEAEKEKLVQEKSAFSQADIERVKATANQINAAKMLLNSHVSVASFLETLEQTTVASVQLGGFSLQHPSLNKIIMSVTADTTGFNATLFQREIVKQNPVLAGAKFTEVSGSNVQPEDPLLVDLFPEEIKVTFKIEKELVPTDIPYLPYTQPTNTTVYQADDVVAEDDVTDEEPIEFDSQVQ